MSFRAVTWPVKVLSKGDLRTGGLSEVVRSHILTVLRTQRYIDIDLPGERRMRPGAYSEVPRALLTPFEPDIIQASVRQDVREAMLHLERLNFLTVRDIRVKAITAGVKILLRYRVLDTNQNQEVSLDINTQLPAASEDRAT